MSRHEPSAVPRPRSGHRGLLVLGLLVGLLGMHGLVSVPAAARTSHPAAHGTGHVAAVMDVPDECGPDSGGGGGHPEHADSACASGAVAGSPAFTAPPASTIGDVPRTRQAATVSRSSTDGGRAPPSLAQLQLLRI